MPAANQRSLVKKPRYFRDHQRYHNRQCGHSDGPPTVESRQFAPHISVNRPIHRNMNDVHAIRYLSQLPQHPPPAHRRNHALLIHQRDHQHRQIQCRKRGIPTVLATKKVAWPSKEEASEGPPHKQRSRILNKQDAPRSIVFATRFSTPTPQALPTQGHQLDRACKRSPRSVPNSCGLRFRTSQQPTIAK